MNAPTAIPVFIRNLAGEYLSSDGWIFTPDLDQAHVFDYHADNVAVQLEQAQKELATVWVAVPVDASLISEKCDACGATLSPTDAHFDGTNHFCLACRQPRH
jgi:hypothetical protein